MLPNAGASRTNVIVLANRLGKFSTVLSPTAIRWVSPDFWVTHRIAIFIEGRQEAMRMFSHLGYRYGYFPADFRTRALKVERKNQRAKLVRFAQLDYFCL